jgi:hypothetical protein
MMADFISVVFRGSLILETLLTKARGNRWLMWMNYIRPNELLLLNNLLLYMLITLITYLLMMLNHSCQRMIARAASDIPLFMRGSLPLLSCGPDQRLMLSLLLMNLLLLLVRVL